MFYKSILLEIKEDQKQVQKKLKKNLNFANDLKLQ